MNSKSLGLLLVFWMLETSLVPSTLNQRQGYIEQFKHFAIEEMQRTGIPASIKLGQAILESGGGTSELATFANNHFGLKCTDDWKGETYQRRDDEYDSDGNLIFSCFKKFPNALASFRHHSDLLLDPSRNYRQLLQLNATDYRGWAQGLQENGYATDPNYASKLIHIIEKYKLYHYDLVLPDATSAPPPVNPSAHQNTAVQPTPPPRPDNPLQIEQPQKVSVADNGLFITVTVSETLENIARRTGKSVMELMVYNDFYEGGDKRLPVGTTVYLRPLNDFKLMPEEMPESSEIATEWTSTETTSIEKAPLIADLELVFTRIKKAPSADTPKKAQLKTEQIVPGENRSDLAFGDAAQEEEHFHTIVEGDTLWNISKRYHTTVSYLKDKNQLTSDTIYIGMRLWIP